MAPRPVAEATETLEAGASLPAELCRDVVRAILGGEVPEPLTERFLAALHRKGETAEELHGAVVAVRERMIPFDAIAPSEPCLDTCGTGGDGAHTVNISTATAAVVASCGVRVAKHGNRAASGSSGSSDVLGHLGVAIDAELPVLRRCFDEIGLVFLFAPRFHPGLKGVAEVRRRLPHRTVFNLVGPLCNPASPTHQLVGVPSEGHGATMAGALARSSTIRRAVVVHGSDGLDEVTLDGTTRALVVEGGSVRATSWTAADFGLPRTPAAALRVSGPQESAERLRRLFAGEPGPVRDVVLANAAAALWTIEPGPLAGYVARAAAAIDDGTVARRVGRWAELTGGGR
ncbi:Anthranilate phosphoribosyltransferase [Aquisphaera giovannonii]|uniref:Anthranilate phosphoribosyltransferase n=1 Tax=Aquisphaera giovannonii TaxID=406548 RepID=A0A5B9W2Y5_9BACT|nr:anthranilate phosphoribosyltransferase [Aquisphaera giovannonii]QEH34320.1 Anthranilate phosphoribosyltransferase [Aquisphaera giovannonii]